MRLVVQYKVSLVQLPVLTTHGNRTLATGEGKLAYVEAFPPVGHRWSTD